MWNYSRIKKKNWSQIDTTKINTFRQSINPRNDLALYQNLLKYKTINKEIADAALNKFDKHLWYLGPVFSLFSDKVSFDEKAKMISNMKNSRSTSQERDLRPEFATGLQNKSLSDFVTARSLNTIMLLKIPNYQLLFEHHPNMASI